MRKNRIEKEESEIRAGLMHLSKENIITLFLKSEKIRKRQNEIIEKLEKSLEEYEERYLTEDIEDIFTEEE